MTSRWATPQTFFDKLDAEFHFELDVCASHENAKCPRYFTVEDDGLAQDWGTATCWCNPPYGHEIKKWMAKAVNASRAGARVVALVPVRTSARWWHDYATKASEIRFVKGRLVFGDCADPAPFSSAVLVFEPSRPGGTSRRFAPSRLRQCGCGTTFTARRSDAHFCSNACRQRAYRQRAVHLIE
jgi:phage N-6-adenine-methyltransferase